MSQSVQELRFTDSTFPDTKTVCISLRNFTWESEKWVPLRLDSRLLNFKRLVSGFLFSEK